MSERMLSESDVLVRMGWPSHKTIKAMIRSSKFPRPAVCYRNILGDQWRESDIDAWISGKGSAEMSGENKLLERFS